MALEIKSGIETTVALDAIAFFVNQRRYSEHDKTARDMRDDLNCLTDEQIVVLSYALSDYYNWVVSPDGGRANEAFINEVKPLHQKLQKYVNTQIPSHLH